MVRGLDRRLRLDNLRDDSGLWQVKRQRNDSAARYNTSRNERYTGYNDTAHDGNHTSRNDGKADRD